MAEDNDLMKKIEMDEVTESYLQKTISSLLPTDHIIVTDHHNRVFDIIEKKQYFKGKGIYISGPPGSGKSTTCVYLYQVLKEKNIPFVVFSTGSLAPINKAMLQRYLCEGVQGDTNSQQTSGPISQTRDAGSQQALEPIFPTRARDWTSENIIEEFIRTRFKDHRGKRVIFFDTSSLLKSELACRLLDLAIFASNSDWVVIVAVSSGSGWTIGSNTTDDRKMSEDLMKMRKEFVPVKSQNFTKDEADVFITHYMIDSKQLDEQSIELNNNPRLLYMFAYTHQTTFLTCHSLYCKNVMKLVSDLLEVMKRKEFSQSLKNCVTWLENARHGVHIPIEKLNKFNGSYLSSENLAYYELCENNSKFKIMLYIPDVYDYLVDALRDGSWSYDVLSIPVVRGYIFEKEFLSSPKLEDTPLIVLAVGTSGSLVFNLPPLYPCQGQLSCPLKTKLKHRQIYHLRQRHPAIDAVAFIDGDKESFTLNDATVSCKCLFLLQLSTSAYKNHEAKGSDIKKTIPAMEGGKGSIAEYYQNLCPSTVDKVIYVYISPKETSTSPPSSTVFNYELNARGTRSSTSSETTETLFSYGFLMTDSRGAMLVDEINNSIG